MRICRESIISQESIKNLHTSDVSFAPKFIGNYQYKKVEFKGICLKHDTVSFLQKNSKFIYFFIIRYMINRSKHRFYTRLLHYV